MASADAALRLDEPDRLRFAHAPVTALLFAIVSFGFTWLCWTFIDDDAVIRYGFTAFSLIFVIAGVFGIFWRNELDIDLVGRRVRIRRGLWPSPKTRERSLDEADGVFLTLEYRSSGSRNSKRKVPWWFVCLRFPEDKRGTCVFTSRKEVEAYAKWEHYSDRLSLDAVDATGDELERRNWRDLDENLAARIGSADDTPLRAPPRPSGSDVRIVPNRGRREYVLPMPGISWGLVFLAVFGGAFVALGSVPLLAGMGVLDIEVNGSEAALMIVPPVFILAGLGIVWLGVKASYTSVVIGTASNELFIERLAFGKRSAREAILFSAIESIDVGGDVGSRRRAGGRIRVGGLTLGSRKYRNRVDEVVVRSDDRIMRFGSSLSDEDKAWLVEACRYAVFRGNLP